MSGVRGRAVPNKLKLGVLVAGIAGLALATGVIGYIGFGAVFSALAAIGWRGFGFYGLYAALPFALLGSAWFVIAPKAPENGWRTFFLARVVRDSAGELLPFSHLGGFVVGARAAVLQGVSPATASATTIVDVTTELIAQLGFTALGVALLAMRLGGRSAHDHILAAGLIGLGLSAIGAVAFVLAQRRAGGLVERLARRFAPELAAKAGDFKRCLDAIYAQPLRLAAGVAIHLAAWVASGAGAWFALRLAGVDIGLANILAIESLVCAVRSAAFFAPMAVGVQEAAYGLVGPLFGLPAELAVAISLIRRARDLAIGVPALIGWQSLEGHRLASARRRPVLETD